VRARHDRDGVVVHGYVPDPASLLSAARLMVVPLRAGGGMRVRILNGLAAGVPIVTTAIGCEGIGVEPGRHLLVADGAEAFAAAVVRLLDDPALAAALARQGRELVRARYDASVVCVAVDDLYERAVARRRRFAA
jgi:glycosyltransferase involved in cell wall biosynthesis